MAQLSDGTPLNVATYNAFRKAGLTDAQARAMTAEVGRENSFSASTYFGSHTDKAKTSSGGSIRNIGMLSWNQGRDTQLLNFMAQRGITYGKDGFPKTQATVDAQAAFAVSEMRSPKYANKLANFWKNPNQDPDSYARELGKNYIGWAYGQNSVKAGNGKRVAFDWVSHDNRRRGYLTSLDKALGGNGGNYTPTADLTQQQFTAVQVPQAQSLMPFTRPNIANASMPQLPTVQTPADLLARTVADNAYTVPGEPTPIVAVNGNLTAPENKREFDLFNGIINSGLTPQQESNAVLAGDKLAEATQQLKSQSLMNTTPLFGQLSNLFDMVNVDGSKTG